MVKRWKVEQKRGKKRRFLEEDTDCQPVAKKQKFVHSQGKKRARLEEDREWQPVAKKRRCDEDFRGENQLVAKKQKCVREEDDTPSVGAAFAGIGFDNSCFHLIWKNVNIRLNQENLSQQNGTYGLQAAIFQTLNYQTDYRKSRAVLSG